MALTLSDVLLARQPILDSRLELQAYELLFRTSEENRAAIIDGDRASCEVLMNAFCALSLEALTGPHPVFVNLTRNLLFSTRALPFPKEQVVIEILEDVPVDDELIAIVKENVAQGFRFALDDFEFNESYLPLLPHVQYVKLDVLAHTRNSLAKHVALLKPYAVTLLAEKIETHEEFRHCQALGFQLFQGYFLCKPDIVKGQKIKSPNPVILRLLEALHDSNVSAQKIEQLLAQDPALSFKLLRFVNSAAYNLPRKVENLRQAVALMGLDKLKSLVAIVVLCDQPNKSSELVRTLLVRARFCERLAQLEHADKPGSFFMTGLLSGLDAILDIEFEALLPLLPLSDDIGRAILRHEGPMGRALQHVIEIETAAWPQQTTSDLTLSVLKDLYSESLVWVNTLFAETASEA